MSGCVSGAWRFGARGKRPISAKGDPVAPGDPIRLPLVEGNALAKRLMWSGLLAGLGALASLATNRVATQLWRQIFDEEPPE